MCKWMIEWLCMTGDWYRKGMSMLDSNPSMSLYLRCKTLENNFIERNSRPLWTFRKHLRSNNIENCNSFDMTVWLICHYFISPRWFLVTAEKKPTLNVNQTTMKTRKPILFRPNWNVEDDLYEFFRFLFSSMTFSCFFSTSNSKLMEKGLIWRWNTLIYH